MTTKAKIKILPLAVLIAHGACHEHLAKCQQAWPDGIPLVPEIAPLVVALGLDLAWASEKLLSAAARAELEKITPPAYAELEKVTAAAAAYAEYDKVTALTLIRLLSEGPHAVEQG